MDLLHLDAKDRAGLEWIMDRSRFWLTALKRRRKYLPPGEPYGEAEAAFIRALAAMENSAKEILKLGRQCSSRVPGRDPLATR